MDGAVATAEAGMSWRLLLAFKGLTVGEALLQGRLCKQGALSECHSHAHCGTNTNTSLRMTWRAPGPQSSCTILPHCALCVRVLASLPTLQPLETKQLKSLAVALEDRQ